MTTGLIAVPLVGRGLGLRRFELRTAGTERPAGGPGAPATAPALPSA